MKLRHPLVDKIVGLSAATIVRAWMGTLEYKAAYYDPTVDPVHPEYRGPKIFLFWHEYILLPMAVRGHCNLAMLLSQHHDAELLRQAARHLGFDFVRGSTRRGGIGALRQMFAKGRRMNLTITPDGPRGPRRRLAQGPIYVASKSGLPLVLLGLGFDRPWRAGSWDRFAVPRPYTRARGVISPELAIPADLDRDGIEHYRRQVERLLNRLTLEAETWAESATRKIGELPARRQHGSPAALRCDAPTPPAGPHRIRGFAPRDRAA